MNKWGYSLNYDLLALTVSLKLVLLFFLPFHDLVTYESAVPHILCKGSPLLFIISEASSSLCYSKSDLFYLNHILCLLLLFRGRP